MIRRELGLKSGIPKSILLGLRKNTSCGTGSKPATRHVWGWTSLYLPTILWFTRDSMCFDSYPWGSSQSVSDGSSFRTGKIVDRISTRGLLYHVSKQHVSKCCPLKSKYCGSSRKKTYMWKVGTWFYLPEMTTKLSSAASTALRVKL